jgi:hypothetical protein
MKLYGTGISGKRIKPLVPNVEALAMLGIKEYKSLNYYK